MKRTLPLLLVLFLEFIGLLFVQFQSSTLLVGVLFFLNILFFLLLILEPYWKLGAGISFLVFIEINLHILNIFILDAFTFISSIFTLITTLFGIGVLLLAHKMKETDFQKYVSESDHKKNHKPELNQRDSKSNPKKKKLQTNIFILVEKNNTVHLDGCKITDEISEKEKVVVGSKRYAKSRGFKPCDKCKPYST